MVDESEVLTPADQFHIEKTKFTIPLGLGAAMKGLDAATISLAEALPTRT